MARRQRVSVQGRGADLFFGDLQPPPEDESPVEETHQAEPVEPEMEPAPSAEPPRDEQESKHASNGDERAREPAQPAELISSAILDAIWRDLATQATVTNAFRYTDKELKGLNDAIYELGNEHGTRVTKQEVARLGLNAILADYEIRGSESLLSEYIARRRSRALGEE